MKTYIKEILDKREHLDNDNYAMFSEAICEKVKAFDEYKQAKTLLIFYPYNGEVNIIPLVQNAIAEGKNVYFPKVLGSTNMDFFKVSDMTEFTNGYKGIKEPIGKIIFDKNCIDDKTVMILPGSVFDLSKNRCGYGKGYYDRYLSDCYEKIVKIGVCFSLQMLDSLPTEDIKVTDVRMDYVVNENEVI